MQEFYSCVITICSMPFSNLQMYCQQKSYFSVVSASLQIDLNFALANTNECSKSVFFLSVILQHSKRVVFGPKILARKFKVDKIYHQHAFFRMPVDLKKQLLLYFILISLVRELLVNPVSANCILQNTPRIFVPKLQM